MTVCGGMVMESASVVWCIPVGAGRVLGERSGLRSIKCAARRLHEKAVPRPTMCRGSAVPADRESPLSSSNRISGRSSTLQDTQPCRCWAIRRPPAAKCGAECRCRSCCVPHHALGVQKRKASTTISSVMNLLEATKKLPTGSFKRKRVPRTVMNSETFRQVLQKLTMDLKALVRKLG